ncbi:olfactory receptor 4K2-like [Choloepus didactylus]|uniref:olfactory receptor 4K2-like n=1 Tax=Choloepus didactylus TaxID=27675 RepID=UPI0018A0171B|nr:olfactory receptor 4K2-like [Choloepus didactylus]
MDKGNQSVVSEFVLLGLCHSWNMQVLLLMIFLMLYLTIMLGNTVIVILVIIDLHLHSPMYFLLANLSLVDMLLSSIITPKTITDFLREMKTISFGGCMCQILFVHLCGGSEMVLLVVMAYDRYLAICKPLHYSTSISLQKCIGLVVASWTIGFVHAMSQMVMIIQLPFCGPREINSFFCDVPLVIKLACMDSYTLGILMNADTGVITMTCFILLLISYMCILLTVSQSSKTGASKALSTCTAHIMVVVLFFGPCIFIYVWPLSITWMDKFLAMFFSVLTPILNPSIYTLRNKEIKWAMKRFRSYHIDFKGNF